MKTQSQYSLEFASAIEKRYLDLGGKIYLLLEKNLAGEVICYLGYF